MTDLEERIDMLKGRLTEFVDLKSVNNLVENASAKAKYLITNHKDVKDSDEFKSVVLYVDLQTVYFGIFTDNLNRSFVDPIQILTFEGEDLMFHIPVGNKFFKEKYKTPLYAVDVLNDNDIRKLAKRDFQAYVGAVKYFEAA